MSKTVVIQVTKDMDSTFPKKITSSTADNEVVGEKKSRLTREKVDKNTNKNKICENLSNDVTKFRTEDATINMRKLFRVVGLKLPEKHRFIYILYSAIVNTAISFYFPFGFGFSYYYLFSAGLTVNDIGPLLTSLQGCINLIALDLKVIVLFLDRSKWRGAVEVMRRLDRRCHQSPSEVDELRKVVRFGNRCAIFYVLLFLAYSSSTVLGAVVVNRSPYDIYFPFLNWRNSYPEFITAVIFEFIMVNYVCIQESFNDSFAVIHVGILRAHMKILLLRFARMGDTSISWDENLSVLKQCIRDHKNYLKLYDIIAPIISKTIFLQFVVTAVILSTTMVNFMLIATDFYSRIGSFFYIIAIILQILPVCYFAQCLMDDSNRLAEVIFHSNWVDQDSRYRKMLVFFMQKTQCSKMLTAGKLFPINLSCCLSIVKFSFTLYTFIKTMGLKEKFASS